MSKHTGHIDTNPMKISAMESNPALNTFIVLVKNPGESFTGL